MMSQPTFKRIYVEITNQCNLSCTFCPPTSRIPGYMSVEDFSFIADQIKPYTNYICLHVKGEPLLHPQLEQILNICGDHNLQVNLTTNGTLLNKKADVLYEAAALRQTNISLHSFDANDCSMDFQSYLTDCMDFVSYISANTKGIGALRLWNLNKKKASASQRSRNESILAFIENYFNVVEPLESRLDEGRGIKLMDRVFLNYDYEFNWPSLDAPFISSTGTCHGLRNQIAILVDGTVVPCCLDNDADIPLGNIFNLKLKDILSDNKSQSIAEGFRNHNLTEELCRHCGYRARF